MQRSRKAPPLTPMNNKVLTLIMTSADLHYRFADCSFKDLLIEIYLPLSRASIRWMDRVCLGWWSSVVPSSTASSYPVHSASKVRLTLKWPRSHLIFASQGSAILMTRPHLAKQRPSARDRTGHNVITLKTVPILAEEMENMPLEKFNQCLYATIILNLIRGNREKFVKKNFLLNKWQRD